MPDRCPPILARVVRDGVLESVHRGHLVAVTEDGEILAALGDPGLTVYARSAIKPFQALATLELLDQAGAELDDVGLAITCASHSGSDTHQIEAARLLALAGLDESALQTPLALPDDLAALLDQRVPTSLAHNCSGKHAGFLYATVSAGHDPAAYLDRASPVQRGVRDHLAAVTGTEPSGPGVDGCGAPAWLAPLHGLALGFARLAGGTSAPLRRVRSAMTAWPDLVGGPDAEDTALMTCDSRLVAKRGAEGVFAAGYQPDMGPAVGVAVKIADGTRRGAAPPAAAALEALGATVPAAVLAPPVLGGGHARGAISAVEAVAAALR